jgi:oxidoreductase
LLQLGTTRSSAGSAEAFKKVDFHYVDAAAAAAKAAGARHFSLVSAQGASPGLWASDWKPFHGLLYAKTKGLAEEAVKAQGFALSTIMRPGLMERGALTRGAEKIYAKLVNSVPAAQVAKAMIADAEGFHSGAASAEKRVEVFEMKDIQRYFDASS